MSRKTTLAPSPEIAAMAQIENEESHNRRRIKVLWIDRARLWDLLRSALGMPIDTEFSTLLYLDPTLPEDAEFVHCSYEASRDAFAFVIHSESFETVEPYEMAPTYQTRTEFLQRSKLQAVSSAHEILDGPGLTNFAGNCPGAEDISEATGDVEG